MKKVILISACLALSSTFSFAEEVLTPATSTTINTNVNTRLCLFGGTPSVEFKTIKRIRVGKGTYGGVTDLYPRLNELADKYKANAVINYNASQRFGFWPWRMVRPVGTGAMVQINSPFNCVALGGTEI